MASIDPPQRQTCRVGEIRTPAVSFVDVLESGELLTGTPLVVEVTSLDLALANKAVNTATLTINGKSVVAGQAVQFKMSGQLAATREYTIKVTASTDADPAQTFVRKLTVLVEA